MAFHRVVPVANIKRATRAKPDIHRNKTQVRGKNQIGNILLVIPEVTFHPLVDFHSVGRLVTHLDIVALQLTGKGFKINEFLSAGSRVGAKSGRFRMLFRILGVQRVEGLGAGLPGLLGYLSGDGPCGLGRLQVCGG